MQSEPNCDIVLGFFYLDNEGAEHLPQISAALNYDKVNYNMKFTNISPYDATGLGGSLGVTQLLSDYWKATANASVREIYNTYSAGISWVPPQASPFGLELTLAGERYISHNDTPNSNSIGLQATFNPMGDNHKALHYALTPCKLNNDIEGFTRKPAVYMDRVLAAAAEQKIVIVGPTITSVSPNQGEEGDDVTINGTNFIPNSPQLAPHSNLRALQDSPSNTQFAFCGKQATNVRVFSSSTAKVTLPSHTAATCDVSACTANGCGSLPAGFTYTGVLIAPITGNTTIGVGSITQLSDATPGGTWSSDSANATVNGSGLVTGVFVGSAAITYTVNGSSVHATITVTPGPATKLAFTVQPSNTSAGSSIAPAITVTVQDALGNTVTSSSASIAMAILNNPGSGTLSGTTPVNAVNGVATFSNLSINKSGTGYTLSASSAGLTSATSNNFNIAVGVASQLVFTAQPTNTAAGSSISAMTATVEDAGGNVVTSPAVSVAMAIGTNPSSGTLSGTTPVTTINGVATFNDLSINKTGTGYTLQASSAGLTSATSNAFNITPGVATKLAFTVQPSNTSAGSSIAPAITVTVQDALGNTVTSSSASIAMAILNNPGSGTLSGTTPVNAVSGIATFSDLSINNAGAGYTLQATSTGLTSITSTAFNITAAAHFIGEAFDQGIVYCLGSSGAAPCANLQPGETGGVIAIADNSAGMQWYNGSFVITNAQSDTAGVTNTSTIIGAQGSAGGSNYAANLCKNYNSGDAAGNWYLPAKNELNGIYTQLTTLNGRGANLNTSGFYWSSTEYSGGPASFAWYQFFSNGFQNLDFKLNSSRVRCVRAF